MLTTSNLTEKSSLAESQSFGAGAHPPREETELRAYQIYIGRGCADGHDVDDWLQAEHELVEKYADSGRIAKAAKA